ncbi:probable cation-transporting ATPase 13A3 [Octopus sinensis]|uniref:Cation-transporting ATPase n=1 Tax=Octopus sinensis TaxID=2607531 RepID=A0A6P7SUQ4_9MOLL|nr:probable cation-transporting ATPase 13A3 [Octopus sinensis]
MTLKKDVKVNQALFGLPPMLPDRDYINGNEEDQMEIIGYRLNKKKKFFYWILTVLSLGFLHLFCYWLPRYYLYLTCDTCSLEEAENVLLQDQYKQWFVAEVRIIATDGVSTQLTKLADASFSMYKGKLSTAAYLQDSAMEQSHIQSVQFFIIKKLKYIWDSELGNYRKLRGLEEDTSLVFFHDCKGLTSDEVIQRRNLYGENSIPIHVTPIIVLLFKEILSPFYVFQLFSIILWMIDEYVYYASSILIISVVSISTAIYQTRKMQRALRNTIHSSAIVTVCRDNNFIDIQSEDLVPGDLIEVPRSGCLMQCDAVLISGNCIVNESVLTGESVPVLKTPLPYPIQAHSTNEKFKMDDHSRHVLFCGTRVIQTRYYENQRVQAVILRTGFSTTKGELTRSILFPKPIDINLTKDTYIFILILSILAFMEFIYTIVIMIQNGVPGGLIAIRALDLITIAIPPALPAALTVGTVFAQARLKKASVYCISPSNINICGNLDVICFDKTGTLTEDGLNLRCVVPCQNNVFSPEDFLEESLPKGLMLHCMATCHSLMVINNELSGDPIDLIMFEASNWELKEPGEEETRFDMMAPTIVAPRSSPLNGINKDSSEISDQEIGIIRQFPFSSRLQRMSVIARKITAKNFEIYTKGSPEMVASLCQPETIPYNFQEVLIKFTKFGYRVLAFAYKPIKLNYMRVQRVTREQVEKDLQFVGLIVFENRLKDETAPTIEVLNSADVKTVMVTGDNMLTSLCVARKCKMVDCNDQIILVQAFKTADNTPTLEFVYTEEKDRKVEEVTATVGSTTTSIHIDEDSQRFHFAVTGDSWSLIRDYFPDVLSKLVVRGKVFARMAPKQKAQLVEVLQSLGYHVGMCGDGANDCGALKIAHAGISLSETEASVASAFTSKIPTIECVPTVIKQGRASLVTTFGIFKYMACYSLIQSTSVLILYKIACNLTDIEFLYIDLFIILTLGVTFGRTDAYPEISKELPPSSLVSFPPVLSLIFQTLIQVLIQIICFISVYNQSWFIPYIPNEEEEYLSYENAAIFLSSCYQYIIMAVIYSKGRPFRKSIFSNYFFLVNVFLAFLATIFITVYPFQGLAELFELKPFPSVWYRLIYVGIAIINFLFSLLVELFIVENRFLCKKIHDLCECLLPSSNCEYVAIEQEIAEQSNWPPISESKASLCDIYSNRDSSMARRGSENLNFDSEEDQLNSSKNSEYKKPMPGERDMDSSKTKLDDIHLGEELPQAEEMNQNLLGNYDSEFSAAGENRKDSTTIITAATVSASFTPDTSDNRTPTDIGLAADDTAMDNLGTPCLATPPTNKYNVTKFNTRSLSVNL